jgi:hypothetical protein
LQIRGAGAGLGCSSFLQLSKPIAKTEIVINFFILKDMICIYYVYEMKLSEMLFVEKLRVILKF